MDELCQLFTCKIRVRKKMKHRFSRKETCACCAENLKMQASVKKVNKCVLQGSDIMSPVQQKKIEDIWSSPTRKARDLKRPAKSTEQEPKPDTTPKSKSSVLMIGHIVYTCNTVWCQLKY